MSFDLNSGEDTHENQLSLFALPTLDIAETSTPQSVQNPASPTSSATEGATAVDYQIWSLAHQEPEPNKTSKFMTLSMAMHAAALLAIAMMTVPLVEQVKTETITIEIAEPPAPPRSQTRGEKVLPTQGGTPVIAREQNSAAPSKSGGPAATVNHASDVIAATKAAKSAKMAKANKDLANKSPKALASNKAGRSVAPKTTFKAVPMTIDDIEAPELDQGVLAKAPVKSEMTEDFNEEFENIDRSHKKTLASEKAKLDSLASAVAAEQDEELKSLEEKNKEDSARLAALQKSLRKNNAKAIASAIAAERASAQAAAAAREAAERDAAGRAAALAAATANRKNSGLGGDGHGYGQGQGAGAGNNGPSTSDNRIAGSPNGVRSLDQLRQMPGNPRPQYDREERRRGDQGTLAFVAYVNKEGYVSKFRLMKSTGFNNLDSKTLEALKKWRFYPGQEGWVELPFRWDIKGGIQEDGGRLRTSVSQR